MSTPELKPNPYTPPFWLTVASIVVSAVLSSTVTAAVMRRDVDDIQGWRKEAQVWMVAMDKRVATNEQQVAVTNKGNEKDMQQIKDQLNTIQQMLIGRPSPVVTPANGRQPYP